MRTASIDQTNLMRSNIEYFLNKEEKSEFAIASELKGFLKKKSPTLFAGWQKRYFCMKLK
jgi:hypothetical protein